LHAPRTAKNFSMQDPKIWDPVFQNSPLPPPIDSPYQSEQSAQRTPSAILQPHRTGAGFDQALTGANGFRGFACNLLSEGWSNEPMCYQTCLIR
jgi:hypothetical protein